MPNTEDYSPLYPDHYVCKQNYQQEMQKCGNKIRLRRYNGITRTLKYIFTRSSTVASENLKKACVCPA